MAGLDLIANHRRQAMLAAAGRWQKRTEARSADAAVTAALGPGAADSPMRQARFAARQAVFRQAESLRERGKLPFFIERKIGPTLDYLSPSPSDVGRKAGRPVARIVSSIDPHVVAEGFATGFLISSALLITNWHVFPDIALAVGTGANFLHERDENGLQIGITFEIDPKGFYVSDEALDYAIVAVKPIALTGERLEDLGIVGLTEATSKILIGHKIDMVEYPDGGEKRYVTNNNQLVDILDEGFLHYVTDTDEGSSGSPAFSEAWELVALHHAAIPEVRDGQIINDAGGVWTEDMGENRVHWVANEGVRISAIVQSLGKKRLANPAQSKILSDLLKTTTDPVDDITRLMSDGGASRSAGGNGAKVADLGNNASYEALTKGANMSGTSLNFSGPVTIHAYAPDIPLEARRLPPAGEISGPEKSLRFDPNYDDREGYNENFLGAGLTVPQPTVAAERIGEMYTEDKNILVLKYHHYSLAMNRSRRLQMWSAVNVDYDPATRTVSGRAFFGTDKWRGDPRIPAQVQIADPDFYGPAGQVDRGHVVRREDSAWGATPEEIEFANSDTFHWTNCTPQHAAFNRGTPGGKYGQIQGLWGGFESYVQKSLQHGDTKACILAGPVLSPEDPTIDFGTGPVQYPIRFWKVVVVAIHDPAGQTSLRAYGFLLSQKDVVDKFGIEFAPGEYARYQCTLAEIANLAGVVFDTGLHNADTKAAAAADAPDV